MARVERAPPGRVGVTVKNWEITDAISTLVLSAETSAGAARAKRMEVYENFILIYLSLFLGN